MRIPFHILKALADERARQDLKFGALREQPHTKWFTIQAEEHGEVARAILEHDGSVRAENHLRSEITQVAAVCIAWLEAMDRQETNKGVGIDI